MFCPPLAWAHRVLEGLIMALALGVLETIVAQGGQWLLHRVTGEVVNISQGAPWMLGDADSIGALTAASMDDSSSLGADASSVSHSCSAWLTKRIAIDDGVEFVEDSRSGARVTLREVQDQFV